MKSGIIFDIQRSAYHDGPGIRTTVFLKGCPLRCKWCHNPESWSAHPQLSFASDQCVMCRSCRPVCPNQVHGFAGGRHTISFEQCFCCGACIQRCPVDALKLYGRRVAPEDVLEILVKDRTYYEKSGGGVTISGGEPLMQWEFTRDLLHLCKERDLHTCLDTSGYASEDVFLSVLDDTDLFLLDYKATDRGKHKDLTGVYHDSILANLELIQKHHKTVILRCPMIPGINDDTEHLRGIGILAATHDCIDHVDIMAYHDMGVFKAENIGCGQNVIHAMNPDEEQKKRWLSVIRETGYRKVGIG